MKSKETRCAGLLKAFLTNEGYNVEYEEGPDPPDIVMKVNGQEWGVEHTSLNQYADVRHLNIRKNEMSRSDFSYWALKLRERLLKKTMRRGQSSWVLQLYGPTSHDNAQLIEQKACRAIVENDPGQFSGFPDDLVRLCRSEDGKSEIKLIFGWNPLSKIPGFDKLTSDVQAVVDYAVIRALRNKNKAMRLSRSYDKRVLLLENDYYFADATHVTRSLQAGLELMLVFDYVFLVDGDSVTRVSSAI